MPKYLNQNQYAIECDVSRQAIGRRIKRGTLDAVEFRKADGEVELFIDIEANPPERRKAGAKKKLTM